MEAGYHDVARGYIVYREEHKKLREDSPRNLKILRCNGASFVRFNPMKIASAIERGFRDTLKLIGPTPSQVIESVNALTLRVVEAAVTQSRKGTILSIELIQDEIEQALMAAGYFQVAKDYILYRRERAEKREYPLEGEEPQRFFLEEEIFTVTKLDGTQTHIGKQLIHKRIAHACQGLEDLVSIDQLTAESIGNFYPGIKEEEIDIANIMAAKARIEVEPAYTKVAANLLLDVLYREVLGVEAHHTNLSKIQTTYFKKYVQKGVAVNRLNPALLGYDLDKLADALDLKRDRQFTYLGLQTLYDRYFIHHDHKRLETPQIFWMRVAMGVALQEKERKEERAIEFYNVMSKFLYISATPTLFNAGTTHSQLSSCYLSTVMDDLSNIFKIISDDAQLSKWAGGLGNDWTNVRATGALIKGTNGRSQGVIPFLKVANDTAVAVNQCFAPETLIYTAKGIQPIFDVKERDLVLGTSGCYREVLENFCYNQTESMVTLSIEHSIDPIHVTSGHPFFAIQHIPVKQANGRTLQWLEEGKLKCEWIEANQLEKGDYIAQVIPKEVVPVNSFTKEDARFYGILLSNGHFIENNHEEEILSLSATDFHLEFIRDYLQARKMHFVEENHKKTYFQITWAAERNSLCEGTTGRTVGGKEHALPFLRDDLYDKGGKKWIAPRLSHLPHPQTLALVQGLIETDKNSSKDGKITFSSTSRTLAEGLRYQLLRLGIPTGGTATEGRYDIRIPVVPELATLISCQSSAKKKWLTYKGFLFSKLKKREQSPSSPFVFDLKVEGDESYMTTAGLAHNGGKRKGAMCAYLETWHLDIEDFLELRKNTGDERRRTHDMNTANWIPDLFMKRVLEKGKWTLFSPNDVPDLHDLYGKTFETRYVEYEKMVDEGKIKLHKRVEAVELWRKMLGMVFETGHPWLTFKDPSNIRSPQDHVGVIHSSNLCTEILLNTSLEETAVCNLGSINLPAHTTEKGLNKELLAQTIRTAIRMLDNVIDINFYPIPEARTANLRHRAIGLGVMGFQDALYILNLSYASLDAVEFADQSMELISYYAILASSELAKERGSYSTYKGSKWDRGILPIDSLNLLEQERGSHLSVDKSFSLDWTPVRESIAKYGMRNCNTMAIAPTATISNITGITQSIEPSYKHLFVKSNLSGEFTVVNTYLVDKLKQLGLWDAQMIDDLKYFDGSILEIERIPDEIKNVYLTAFEIEPEWLIECGSRRQKWIDMGESLNLYLAEASGKKLSEMYLLAWERGLKTTYYLRTLGATHIEKSTTDINARGLQPRWMKSKSASANIKVERDSVQSDVCHLGEECESCQ
ncbi:MAG: ribonucleoside-diphosphate reductase subunit alpha [Chlamydiia bacterium]|nr:ribonucleoside-diphosphate reductase subunit alpha [Chlamydiia bacterium]